MECFGLNLKFTAIFSPWSKGSKNIYSGKGFQFSFQIQSVNEFHKDPNTLLWDKKRGLYEINKPCVRKRYYTTAWQSLCFLREGLAVRHNCVWSRNWNHSKHYTISFLKISSSLDAKLIYLVYLRFKPKFLRFFLNS